MLLSHKSESLPKPYAILFQIQHLILEGWEVPIYLYFANCNFLAQATTIHLLLVKIRFLAWNFVKLCCPSLLSSAVIDSLNLTRLSKLYLSNEIQLFPRSFMVIMSNYSHTTWPNSQILEIT